MVILWGFFAKLWYAKPFLVRSGPPDPQNRATKTNPMDDFMKYAFALMMFCMTTTLLASGFGLHEQGVVGQGNAGAYVARAENNSALAVNPAGLARLDFSEFSFNIRGTTGQAHYSNEGQSTWRSDLYIEGLPGFFFNKSFGRVAIGLGSTMTHHQELDWDEVTYPGRYLFNRSSFEVREHLAGLAFRLSDSTSLGVTARFADLDYSFGRRLARPMDASAPSLFYEVQEEIEQSGNDIGYSVGFLWYPNRRRSFGITYHSPIEIDLDGNIDYTQATQLDDPRAQQAFAGAFAAATTTSAFEIPERLHVGFSTRATVRTRVEFDLMWEGWSAIERYDIQTTNSLGEGQIIIPRAWEDTTSIRIGADFQQKRALLWQIGLAAMESPVPQETFQPDFPDYDRFAYSFGVAYTFKKKYTLEGAWQLIQGRDRNSDNTEYLYDPNSPDYIRTDGQSGLYESQQIDLNIGLRVRL